MRNGENFFHTFVNLIQVIKTPNDFIAKMTYK